MLASSGQSCQRAAAAAAAAPPSLRHGKQTREASPPHPKDGRTGAKAKTAPGGLHGAKAQARAAKELLLPLQPLPRASGTGNKPEKPAHRTRRTVGPAPKPR
eukprot:SAG22_NODE_13602_length_400_cov_21.408638_1_plen_101_part_10